MSSKATLAFLICGVIMHYSVICSPVGLSFPSVRYVHLHLTPTVTFEVDIASLKGGACALSPRRVCFPGLFVRLQKPVGLLDNSIWQTIYIELHEQKHSPASGCNVIQAAALPSQSIRRSLIQ